MVYIYIYLYFLILMTMKRYPMLDLFIFCIFLFLFIGIGSPPLKALSRRSIIYLFISVSLGILFLFFEGTYGIIQTFSYYSCLWVNLDTTRKRNYLSGPKDRCYSDRHSVIVKEILLGILVTCRESQSFILHFWTGIIL